jgi:hypothetical protein
MLDLNEMVLVRLHEVGTANDKANNRKLQASIISWAKRAVGAFWLTSRCALAHGFRPMLRSMPCTMILLWLFSPIVTSLSSLQQASLLKIIQKKFGIAKTSLGSLSESVRVFDPVWISIAYSV